MLDLEPEGLALAGKLCNFYPEKACWIWNVFGLCHCNTGSYARACELHEQQRVLWEKQGDRRGLSVACSNLGNCYYGTGDFERARELYDQERALSETIGDQEGVATACYNLGNCYFATGDFARARDLYEESRAISEELGDRSGLAAAYSGLGNYHACIGEDRVASELYEQEMTIWKALGDRGRLAKASGNRANCHFRDREYGLARKLHEEDLATSQELGDREGVLGASFNLGMFCVHMGDFESAVSYLRQAYSAAKQIGHKHREGHTALCMGATLRLKSSAYFPCRAAELLGPRAPAAFACSDDAMFEAEKWLQIALDLGHTNAHLHLARLAFDAGDEHNALEHLRGYLSWSVEQKPNWCSGCGQTRGLDAPMLTCGGCRVARFCSADHQKDGSRGGNFQNGRHKDVCGLLGKWRTLVVKKGLSPDVLDEELLAFLRQ